MRKIGNDKLVKAQIEGLCKARQLVQVGGIEALDKEIKFRNISYIPLKYSQEKIINYFNNMTGEIFDGVLLLTLVTLHDEFGFGKERTNRFLKRYFLKFACMRDKDITELSWEDINEQCKEELGFDINMDYESWRR